MSFVLARAALSPEEEEARRTTHHEAKRGCDENDQNQRRARRTEDPVHLDLARVRSYERDEADDRPTEQSPKKGACPPAVFGLSGNLIAFGHEAAAVLRTVTKRTRSCSTGGVRAGVRSRSSTAHNQQMARRNQSAVHGDTVAVGVILDDAPNGDQGSAYVFVGLHR